MKGYKLFRKRKDGSFGPLFINRKQKLFLGEVYKAEEHKTKGYAFRPGWHICSKPNAPHLSYKDRVWCLVEFSKIKEVIRPLSQGGLWYLGESLQILEELK